MAVAGGASAADPENKKGRGSTAPLHRWQSVLYQMPKPTVAGPRASTLLTKHASESPTTSCAEYRLSALQFFCAACCVVLFRSGETTPRTYWPAPTPLADCAAGAFTSADCAHAGA